MRSVSVLGGLLVVACVGPAPPPPGDGDESTAASSPTFATEPMTFDGTADSGSQCGNGIIEDGEQCDGDELGGLTCAVLGPEGTIPSGGTLACSAACTIVTSACTYCGDGVQEGTEPCDGPDLGGASCRSLDPGFDGGTLACAAGCVFDTAACTMCGNGIVEGTEECESVVVGLTCADFAPVGTSPSGGALQCSATCTVDPSGCTYCGNGIREDTEACDGSDLGGEDCESFDNEYGGGDLDCASNCMDFDDSDCCLNDGADCSTNSDCCSSDCDNALDVCMP